MRTGVHAIETASYAILRERLDTTDLPPLTRAVVERVVHTSADPSWAGDLVCAEGALRAGRDALAAGAPLIVDVRMVAAGITARPTTVALDLAPVARPGVDDAPGGPARGATVGGPARGAAMGGPARGAAVGGPARGAAVGGPPAAAMGGQACGAPITTRSAAGIRAAVAAHPDGAVWVVGNAPTALAELVRCAQAGLVRTPLVIGLPVGFVGAVAAKAALRAAGLPALSNRSERGGAAVAAAAVNALLYADATA